MDFSKIKHLVQANGDKFIFLENGEPEIVVLSFHEYQKLLRGSPATPTPPMVRTPARGYRAMPAHVYPDYVESVGNELEETEFLPSEDHEYRSLPARPEDIRLEDLPL